MTEFASLYINPEGDAVMHYTGFSLSAAIALPLWALQRRMFIACMTLLVLTPALHSILKRMIALLTEDHGALLLLHLGWFIGYSIVCGLSANRVHLVLLKRRGYSMIATEHPAPP
jgi:hypothetical protein